MRQAIIEIIKQKKGIYQIITRADAFVVSESMLSEFNLYKGNNLSAETIVKIKKRSELEICYQKALDLMARRDHFVFELKIKLQKRDFPLEVIEESIKRLKANQMIDELAFAKRLVGEKAAKFSKQKIKKYLLDKGCPESLATEALILVDEDEKTKAYQTLVRKFANSKNGEQAYQRDKMLRHLANQGFSYSDALAAYDQFCNDFMPQSCC